jgi:aldehyde:ferredoxin oxidoreductase
MNTATYIDIDLARKTSRPFEIPADWLLKNVGGRGIGGRILLEELNPSADPLGPENIMIFGSGPLQGTGFPGAGRHIVMCKSPKTKSVSDSYAGGFFGQALVQSGYDGIIFRGVAKTPLYITVIDGDVSFHNAEDLWGSYVYETEAELKRRHGDVRVACIGPAGENLVKQACIISDRNRAVGRPAFGAVMGSKKLKAVVVGGKRKKTFSDAAMLQDVYRQFVKNVMNDPRQQFLQEFGTAGYLEVHNDKGIQPSRNFVDAFFDEASKIGGKALNEILVKRDNCYGCPVRCKRVVKTEFEGHEVIPEYGGPEYETIAAFGTLCMNSNLHSIALANQRCNALGLDTISAGVSIAFAMEASEKGLIPEKIEWGDPHAVLMLIEQIAKREGLGGELADGIDSLAQKIGADFAMVIKGQEIPLHEPRGKKGMALTYATTPRGGQHMEGIHDDYLEISPVTPELGIVETISRFDWTNRPFLCKVYEDLTSFNNSLMICDFVVNRTGKNYNYPLIRKAFYAVTGIELSAEDMVLIGERNFNILRLLSARHGYRRSDDGLPARFEQPLPRGASAGESIPKELLAKYIDEYYKTRGWDEWGPTKDRLDKLQMAELKDYVEERE